MRFWTPALLACLLILFTATSAARPAAAAPFDFDRAFGRLPKNVVPIDYTIALVPNVAGRSIAGTESIALRVRSATKTIQFNTLNETLRHVRLDGQPVARAGMHRLTFAYTARMETSPQGFDKGMERAAFDIRLRASLDAEADAYVRVQNYASATTGARAASTRSKTNTPRLAMSVGTAAIMNSCAGLHCIASKAPAIPGLMTEPIRPMPKPQPTPVERITGG